MKKNKTLKKCLITTIATAAKMRACTLNPCEKNSAITTMAPKSSIIAKASKKIFSGSGTCLLNNAMIPNAKAMSVAMGMPQPEADGVPELKKA